MAIDHIPHLRCWRLFQKLLEYRPPDQHRMSPRVFEARYRNRGVGPHQSVDGGKGNRRMVHQREKHGVGFVWHNAQPGLQGGEHAQWIVRILDSPQSRESQSMGRLNRTRRIESEDRNHRRAALTQSGGNVGKKSPTPKGQKSLGTPHPARFPSRENDRSRIHSPSLTSSFSRRRSSRKIDFESVRQLPSGSRRMAIISAATLIAISSGETAPISKPIGA